MTNTPTNQADKFKFPDELDKTLLVLMKGRKNTTYNHAIYNGVKTKIAALFNQQLNTALQDILDGLPEEITAQEADDRQLHGWNYVLEQCLAVIKGKMVN